MHSKRKVRKNAILKTLNIDQYVIRISKTRIDIETASKNWKIVYAENTTQYEFISYLVYHDDKEALRGILLSLYSTNLFFSDAQLVKDFLEMVGGSVDRISKDISNDDDKEILNQDKKYHEVLDKVNKQKEEDKQ